MIKLEQVFGWLNQYSGSRVSPSSGYLIRQISEELARGEDFKAKNHLQQLKNLSVLLQDAGEVMEVRIVCGRAAYRLHDLAEAGTILEDAVSRSWHDHHKRAVALWMLGVVQWEYGEQDQAIQTWQNSLADFQKLAARPSTSPDMRQWYKKVCQDLEQSLVEALSEAPVPKQDAKPAEEKPGKGSDTNKPAGEKAKPAPASGPAADARTAPAAKPAEGRPVAGRGEKPPTAGPAVDVSQNPLPPRPVEPTPATHTWDVLQLFEVSEEIPAGDFGPSGVDPFPIGMVEVDSLRIDRRKYRAYNPRGRKPVSLPADQKVVVVKVKGDSMDQENILPGDFVILRRAEMAASGDIVMAEIIGDDSSATLKKFTLKNGAVTLQPHSSNPDHKPFHFKKVGDGFYIRGVVIAVLKPV